MTLTCHFVGLGSKFDFILDVFIVRVAMYVLGSIG